MNIQQTWLYWLAGIVLFIVAILSWRDKSNPRRLTTGLFWGLYGLLFLPGDWTYQLVGDKHSVNIAVGVAVVVLALIAGSGACIWGIIRNSARKHVPTVQRGWVIDFFTGAGDSAGDRGGRAVI